MFDYIGSLVVWFFRIVFIQAKFQISLSLSNIRMTTRTFKFIYHIASFQMCLLVLVLKMISNRMCFMKEILKQILLVPVKFGRHFPRMTPVATGLLQSTHEHNSGDQQFESKSLSGHLLMCVKLALASNVGVLGLTVFAKFCSLQNGPKIVNRFLSTKF